MDCDDDSLELLGVLNTDFDDAFDGADAEEEV